MSLEFAILGFLNQRSYSGYDLKKVFDTSVRHFWPADQSQIYRTLSRMKKDGWVETQVVHQENRPDRKEYSITEQGRTALMDWLATPLQPEENRSADMIQVFFASNLSDKEAVQIFERAEANMQLGLAQYRQISKDPAQYSDFVKSPREFFFMMLTLEVGENMMKSNIEFLQSVIKRFKDGEVPPA
jgi:DNA-binding PadR family transcriptional regulator